MTEKVKRTIWYDNHLLRQSEIYGRDNVEYRKNRPKGDFWYGLNIRVDGTDPHIYLYGADGKEVNKDDKIEVPDECLYEKATTNPGDEWRFKWPESAATCVCTEVFYDDKLEIEVSSENNERILKPSVLVPKWFLVFLDKNGRPIPRSDI